MNTTDYAEFMNEWADEHLCDDSYKSYIDECSYAIPMENFYYDGYINKEEYEKAKVKILFIAKECHIGDLHKGQLNPNNERNDHAFFAKVYYESFLNGSKHSNRFMLGIAMLTNAIFSGNYKDIDKNWKLMSGIAVVNLNKRGGYSKCVLKTLDGYVNKYQNYIRQQIKFISPDIIVCCGESVKCLVEQYQLIPEASKVKVVEAFHPSCFTVSDANKLLKLQGQNIILEAKSTDTDNPVGRILNTNNRWRELFKGPDTETEMLKAGEACVYGDARYQIGWYNVGDYVLYFSTKLKGIIAIGKVKSAVMECEQTDKAFVKVDAVVPKNFEVIAKDDKKRKALSRERLLEILGTNNKLRGSVVKKNISRELMETIIEELRKVYSCT